MKKVDYKKKDERSITIYDDPSGPTLPKADRAVFCTFVIIDNKITRLVQWSKEFVIEKEATLPHYSFKVQEWNGSLPLWAVKILDKESKIPTELCSNELIGKVNQTQQEIIDEESQKFFLKPPDNWFTFLNYPDFFKESLSLEENDEPKEKIKFK